MNPDEITDFYDLFDKPQVTPPPPASGGVVTPLNGNTTAYAAKALADETTAVLNAPEGVRNDTLNRAAFNLGQLADILDQNEAADALTTAARASGLDPRETAATIRSGLTAGQQHPRQRTTAHQNGNGTTPWPTTPPATPDPSTVPTSPTEDEARAAWVTENLPVIDWHALWADTSEDEWIIEPLLPVRRLVALYSAPKVGKSLLMLELAVAIATGTPTLGVRLDRPRRVLYIDFENDPKGDIRERLQAMGHAPDQLDRLKYLSYPKLSALDSERGSHELLAAVHHYQCEVVVIDTISRAVQGEENENDTWLNFYRHSGVKLKADGIACIRLDHTGKDAEKGMRGGSAKYGDVDAVWRMTKLTETSYRLDCTDHRMPITEQTLVVHRELVPHLHHRVDAEGKAATWRIKIDAVIDALDKLGQPNDIGRPTAREALKATGVKASNDVMKEALQIRRNRPSGLSGNRADSDPLGTCPENSPDSPRTAPQETL